LGAFFEHQKLVNKTYEIKKNNKATYEAVLKEIKNQNYDFCFCPHQSFRTALFVSRIKAQEKVGFKKWWNRFFFSKRVARDLELPDALRQASLLGPWENNSKFNLYKNSNRELPALSTDLSMQVDVQPVTFKSPLVARLSETNFVLLAPGSQWATKRWTEEGFIDVARTLKSEKFEVALIGMGKDDRDINFRITKAVPGLVDLTDQTDLNELANLMMKAEALVCNDSGLMHLASVAGLPTVAVFGPTTLALGYRPWQNQARVVEKELFCRPCGRHGHQRCPLNTHECMKAIGSSLVLKEFRKVYKVPGQKERY
jgi:heptosyltransferase II